MRQRPGRTSRAIALLRTSVPALILLCAPPARAQSESLVDTVRVQLYHPSGLLAPADLDGGLACPGDVPVADTAATFNGEVTTTNPNGVTYEVEIRYTNGSEGGGALEHANLTSNISSWTVTPESNETVLLLSAQVQPGQTFLWAAALVARAAGTVSYRLQRRLGTITLADETCTFAVTSQADLELAITDVAGALSFDAQAGTATLPLNNSMIIAASVANLGPDLALDVVVSGDVDPAFIVLDSVSVVSPVGVCELNTGGGSFSCPPLTIVDSSSLAVSIAGRGIAVTPAPVSFSVSADHPSDPDLSNNEALIHIDIVTDTVNVVVGGMVFLDLDGNGQLNTPDDQPLEGVTIFADLNANRTYEDDSDPSAVTAADGTFVVEISNDDPTVELGGLLFEGWEWTVPVDGFQEVGAGGEDADFGTRPRSIAIGGFVWDDMDGDGMVDPEEPRLAGWRVYADLNSNGMFEQGEPSDVSDGSGLYIIPNLAPGTYTIRQVGQAGFVQTFPSGPYTATLGEREFERGRNFSNRPESALLGSIQGRVLDVDSDPEIGLDSLVVELRDSEGGLIATDTTRSVDLNRDGQIDPTTERGHYEFGNLPEGVYTVKLLTVPFGTRTVAIGDEERTFKLETGERAEHVNFDLTRLGAIEGTKFLALYSPRERRIIQVPFFLSDEFEIVIEDAETGEIKRIIPIHGPITIGDIFDNTFAIAVPAGHYIVRERVSRGGTLSEVGYVALFPEETGGHRIVVEEGEIIEADFVNAKLSTFTGLKFEDRNGNGDRDPAEPLLPGWTIRVAGPEGVRETVTDASGRYVFEDLLPGFYLVAEDHASMTGFRQTYPSLPEHHVTTSLAPRRQDFGNQRVADAPVNDSGDGDGLRAAIESCNARPAADPPCRIKRAGGGKRSVATIRPSQPLPPITRPAIIDGEGTLVLDGSAAGDGADGLVVTSGGTDIAGLTVTGFSGHAIVLDGEGRNRVTDNVLTANGGSAIRVLSGTDNLVLGNILTANGSLSIDLGDDGPTPNDSDDGDGLQNYPILAAVQTDSGLVVEGTLFSVRDTTFVIEFFAQTGCSSFGEAEIPLGTTTVFTDSLGRSVFTESIDTTFARPHFITATATHAEGRTSELSPCTPVAAVTGFVPDASGSPGSFRLNANYPNPFNPTTTISYVLPQAANVVLTVYDVLGRELRRLASVTKPGGTYEVSFDATGLPSGIYFYRLQAGSYVETKRMVVLK